MSQLLLALVLGAQAEAAFPSVEGGLAAYRAGRYEEAARLLHEALALAPSYDGFMTLGLATGRLGRLPEARSAFERALALDPSRADAWVERGGLSFLEKSYEDAARDLERALRIRGDEYTLDLLSSSLHLAGRSEEALARWNTLGRPLMGSLRIDGLTHTRDRVARREISLVEGQVLALTRLEASRLRLQELGIFYRVRLRPIPLGDGKADLEVAVAERHGLYGGWGEFLVETGANAIGERVRLRYANIAGEGVSLSGQYRWEENRPELSLGFEWPRPLGLPAYVRLQSVRGRQVYRFDDGAISLRSRGLDLRFRRVLAAATVGEFGIRMRDRSYSRPRADAPPGKLMGIEAAVDHRFIRARRHRAEGSLRVLQAAPALGSDVGFARGLLTFSYQGFLSPPVGAAIERSVLAAKVSWGRASLKTPLDEMFTPGGNYEMELPLRAHRQTSDGALGVMPIGRSLSLANVEWRLRIRDTTAAQVGVVFFCDAAHTDATTAGRSFDFLDVGIGLRIALRGAATLRVDYGRGLADGKNALFVGLKEVF